MVFVEEFTKFFFDRFLTNLFGGDTLDEYFDYMEFMQAKAKRNRATA